MLHVSTVTIVSPSNLLGKAATSLVVGILLSPKVDMKIDVFKFQPNRTRKLTNSFKSSPKMVDLPFYVRTLLV